MIKYYPISEAAAREAKRANSWSDYCEGSATASYKARVDEAAEIAERQKKKVDPEYHARIDALLDSYARRLADNINQANRIDASCPSVMIAGGSNFPVRKKEKQNIRRDANMREWEVIQSLINKIKSTGTGGITSDDPRALDKLHAKLDALEQCQSKMKAVNAYYRKNKTLDGCPGLTDEVKQSLTADMQGEFHIDSQPYPSWALSNNNANIRRIKERIATLEKEAARADAGQQEVQGDGYVLKENSEIGRIQFLFDGKPSDEIRALLKSNGFRWAPSESAWQRMLNDNGRSAAQYVIAQMQKMEG